MIAAEFLRQIVDPAIGEFIELRAFAEGKAPYQEFFASPEQAAGQAAAWSNIDGRDVYFGVLPRTRRGGTAADVAPQTDVLWADFDGKNFRGKMGPGSAIAEIANIRLAPQIVVDSGNGYHAYWLLDRPYDFAEAHLGMTAIERAHHSDHCSDAPRILRVPGTFNFKNGETKPVRIVKFDLVSPRYPGAAFNSIYLHSDLGVRVNGAPAWDGEAREGWTLSRDDAPKIEEGGRNQALTRLAGIMVARQMNPDDILTALSWENENRCDPPLMAHEVAAIVRSVERYRK